MPPALQPQPEIITLEQYEDLPEEKRIEVFDGIVYDMASPSQIHQTILTELLVSLRNYIRGKGGNCSVFPAPFDVKLNDNPLTIESTIKVNIYDDLFINFSEIVELLNT